MGAQVLLILCWALLKQASGDPKQLLSVNSSVVKDSASAGSGLHPKLYHNVRLGPYAAPFQAYSYHSPVATSQVALHSIPQAVVTNPGIFKDSYGKFVKPQMAYTTQPQQFVQIQALPAHLSQPLASSPVYQYKTAAPHFFAGSQYKMPPGPTVAVGPTTTTGLGGQPQVYSESFRSFAPPSSYYSYGAGFPTSYVTASSPKPEQLTTPLNQQNGTTQKSAPESQETRNPIKTKVYKFGKTKHFNKDTRPQESQIDSQNIQSQTKITAIVNGEPTTVTLDTKPPVPLLDLSLLEPLTFDNPLVPQLQHFLPTISPATQHALDHGDDDYADDDEEHQQQEIIVEHARTYDNVKKPKPKPKQHKTKKAEKQPSSETPDDGDLPVVYEINTPNRKEIYKEEVVSYKKETKPEPEHYSYNNEKQDKPKVYSYTSKAEEPLAVTRVNYHTSKQSPKHFHAPGEQQEDEQNDEHEESPQSYHHEPEHSEESSAESVDDSPVVHGQNDLHEHSDHPISYDNDADHEYYAEYHPDHKHSPEDSHTHSELRELPKDHFHSELREVTKDHFHHLENLKNQNKHKHDERNEYKKHSHTPKKSAKYESKPSHSPKPTQYHKSLKDSDKHHHSNPPRAAQYHSDHKSAKIKSKTNYSANPKQQVASLHPAPLKYLSGNPIKMSISPTFVPVLPEWSETMRFLKPQKSHAAIKVDPNQHIKYGPTTPRIISIEHFSAPLKSKVQHSPSAKQSFPKTSFNSNPTHVHEKSKRIIIKDESPAELHMHAERVMEQMIGREENNEDDFEKAYKAAAYGFPAYDEAEDEVEKEIFNPDAYGVPHEHLEFKIEDSPFQQYQKEGDSLPKSARLSYKDSADNTKEDYYLDYSVSKPESFLDHHKHKANYYKTFKKNRPEKILSVVTDGDKKRKPERYVAATAIAAPSYIKPKQKQFFAHYGKPVKVEFDYSKSGLHDSAGFHSLPTLYKFKTNFAEPQYQFGTYGQLRPVIHFNGELASMASNLSPKIEKPARNKMYKENWYIKKTTTGVKSR